MAGGKLTGVYKKKKFSRRGRPATGHDPVLTARIPAELLEKLEKWARANNCSRSAAVAVMIERGLKQEEH
jgi:hypothetical protein